MSKLLCDRSDKSKLLAKYALKFKHFSQNQLSHDYIMPCVVSFFHSKIGNYFLDHPSMEGNIASSLFMFMSVL